MQLVRWKPFSEFFAFPEQIDRLFEDSLARMEENLPSWWTARWPLVNIHETDKEVVFEAELAGIDPKEVNLHIEDGRLSIEGERKYEKESKEKDYHRRELACGKFSRSFSLPTSVDQEKIHASYEKGILQINIPKQEERKGKKIEIKVE